FSSISLVSQHLHSFHTRRSSDLTTSSKLNSSLASTAKSLFFCGRARKRKSGFSVPTTVGSKINRVGGNGRMLVPLSELYAICRLCALNSNLSQSQHLHTPSAPDFS